MITDVTARPVVSAITIFYNGERFLGEAIESVLAQTYPSWELLLVDDGSTDGASEIARSYAARHPERIRYLEHSGHRNRGMSASPRFGGANCKSIKTPSATRSHDVAGAR